MRNAAGAVFRLCASAPSSSTARRILNLFEQDRGRIETLGRAASSALRVHQLMRKKPLVGVPRAANELGLTPPTVAAALHHLQRLGIVQEVTGRQRGRLFVYNVYLAILDEGTKPLS